MGTHVYNTLHKDGKSLESIQTLAKHLQEMNFAPGVQHEAKFLCKVATLSNKEKTSFA